MAMAVGMTVTVLYRREQTQYQGIETVLRSVPWNKKSPTMLLSRPKLPTMTISFGLLTSAKKQQI
jgi:hypothetical protein